MQGFIILDYLPRATEATEALMDWVSSGDIVYRVDVQEGLENIRTSPQRPTPGKILASNF